MDKVRPDIPGRRRGERRAEGGLNDLAKLAMMTVSKHLFEPGRRFLVEGVFVAEGQRRVVNNGG